MLTSIKKWGNSQGLRFPKTLLEEAGIQVGDEVSISVQARKIIVEPVNRVHGRYDIRELIAQMPDDYQEEEVDWGTPVGKEVW
ncbi:MAG TPA: AbrB/MazE/SpoVT family DNA-binding domain-containing protein [Desulfobacterales bacterium]|nr:AbrB/MazE/SpoVT family DNA-binding domain-containing protein [Desulfobacterales bacterium]